MAAIRVARWFVFKPPNLGNFWSALDWIMLIWSSVIFYGLLGYSKTMHMHILFSFGTFFPVLASCTKKNLATLVTIIIDALWLPQLSSPLFAEKLCVSQSYEKTIKLSQNNQQKGKKQKNGESELLFGLCVFYDMQ
jgi:hypothetical protein